MSYRHQSRQKARRAARDLTTQGATLAQLERLLAWGLVSHRQYDQLAGPLLDARPEAWEPRVSTPGLPVRSAIIHTEEKSA